MPDGGKRWSPWDALRARPEVEVEFRAELPDGVDGVSAPGRPPVIALARRLLRRDRRAVLTHELVHLERGGGAWWPGMPDSWRAVVARDERQVDAEVARRLVPADELAVFLARADGAVGVLEVAEEFDVPLEVAAVALQLHGAGRPPAWMA